MNDLILPKRRNRSCNDNVELGKFSSLNWYQEFLEYRPINVALYTAIKKEAYVLIKLSNLKTIPNGKKIEKIFHMEHVADIHVKTFLGGICPLIRMNVLINPLYPVNLESGLDITDGDFQDFCQAIISKEILNFILLHVQDFNPDVFYKYKCSVNGLASILKNELEIANNSLKISVNQQIYEKSISIMEEFYPTTDHGLEPNNYIKVRTL